MAANSRSAFPLSWLLFGGRACHTAIWKGQLIHPCAVYLEGNTLLICNPNISSNS